MEEVGALVVELLREGERRFWSLWDEGNLLGKPACVLCVDRVPYRSELRRGSLDLRV